jgi:N-acetylglucosaminyl-diphospho-decaprenol L-rhamnosyltransferase
MDQARSCLASGLRTLTLSRMTSQKMIKGVVQTQQSSGLVWPCDHQMKLAVVIINYRTADLVIQCLQSLLPQLVNACVIVVDNCSPDASATILQNWIADNIGQNPVRLIPSQINGGFSSGNNIGMRAIDAEYYLLLNSDTIVRPEAIAILLQTADGHPEAGLISPRLEWPDETPQQSCFRYESPIGELIGAARTGALTRTLKRFDVPLPASDVIVYPQWTSFACVLVRHEALDEIGFMDEDFFMYFEDVEFCRRARKAGWEIIHNPKARVVHLRGGSSPVKQRTLERKRLPRYYYVSRTRYFYLAYGWFGLTLANILWSLGRCISKCREILGRRASGVPERQWLDIWTNWLNPVASWSQQRTKLSAK